MTKKPTPERNEPTSQITSTSTRTRKSTSDSKSKSKSDSKSKRKAKQSKAKASKHKRKCKQGDQQKTTKKKKNNSKKKKQTKKTKKAQDRSKGGDMERKMITMAHKQRTRMAMKGQRKRSELSSNNCRLGWSMIISIMLHVTLYNYKQRVLGGDKK